MNYKDLAEIFQQLSQTNSRLEKTAILAQFLQRIPMNKAQQTVLLLQGRAFPEWDTRNIGLAAKLVLKAIAQATGHSQHTIQQTFKEKGDLGETAQHLTQHKQQQTLFSTQLSISEVYTTLQHLVSHEGTGSQDSKLRELGKLLTSASPIEAKFIVRTVLEDLRVGIAQGTLRDALAIAFFTTEFSYDKEKNSLDYTLKEGQKDLETIKEKIKRAMDITADFTKVYTHIKQGKLLSDIKLSIGTPCKCMLARKEGTLKQAFQRTGLPARVEYKYDGFRIQIHKKGSKIQLFTRRLEEVTTQFPDVVKAIQHFVRAKECILDAEVVGFDPKNKKYQPFQHISQRIRRKYNIKELAKQLPVEVNVFDILLHNSTILLDEPLHKRLEILKTTLNTQPREVVFAHGSTINSQEEAQAVYQQSLSAGNEGIMIKDLQGTYQPGGRVSAWIKMKPTMQELDLVITKATWGNGKRSKWLTSFTLSCQNDQGELLEVGKVGTGMKEEHENEDNISFERLTQLLEPLITHQKGKDVQVQAKVVVEVAYEEIQKSPTYDAGYALRFPRVLRLRPDRDPQDIATKEEIEDLYFDN